MKYVALIEEVIFCCGYEGDMIISINGINLRVYYQDNDEYIESNVLGPGYIASKNNMRFIWDRQSGVERKKVEVDLFLIYGKIKKITENSKEISISKQNVGGKIKGQVISIIFAEDVRVNCQLLTIDIKNEENIKGIIEGDFIEAEGTYFISLRNF